MEDKLTWDFHSHHIWAGTNVRAWTWKSRRQSLRWRQVK